MISLDFSARVRTAVQRLMQSYAWALITEAELCDEVQQVATPEQAGSSLNGLVIRCYAGVLYTACRQTADLARRNLAYTELHRYLHYNAQKRDPAEADDLAQAALQLVFAQLDRCQQPATFFTFARFKLLQVTKELRRQQAKDRGQDEVDDVDLEQVIEPQPQGLIERVCRQEGWDILLHALTTLRDERQRTTILLKYVDGLADEEIAPRLDITANHVRVLRTRALATLRANAPLRAYFLRE